MSLVDPYNQGFWDGAKNKLPDNPYAEWTPVNSVFGPVQKVLVPNEDYLGYEEGFKMGFTFWEKMNPLIEDDLF